MARKSSGKFIKSAIKRPGALTRAKKKGESTRQAASRLKKSGSPLQKRQANFYLNVLSKVNRGGSVKSSSKKHRVKGHTRKLPSGNRVRVKGHRRKR